MGQVGTALGASAALAVSPPSSAQCITTDTRAYDVS
jgi:hypothetical protein